MRSKYNIVIVLVYMAIATSALLYMGYKMVGNCSVFAHCQTLNIEFKDTAGLVKTNDVRMAGITAGQVQDIRLEGKVAVAVVQVNQNYAPVYKDAHAIVRPKNLLGETYVEIDRGHSDAGAMADGDTIKLINTITPVQIDDVLNALDPDTRTKLQVVINSLGDATAARGQDLNVSTQDLRRIAADLAVTSTSLNQEKDNLDALLVQFDLAQKMFADYHTQLAQVLADWNTASTTVMNHDVQLASALGHLNTVLGDLDVALTPNTGALTHTVATLPATIDHADDFLNISTQVMQNFYNQPKSKTGVDPSINQAYAGTQPGTNAGSPLQDGIALFPRLAQVMLGVNTCDQHIYANGYYNVPGTTEPASCPSALINPSDPNSNAASPNLTGEAFTGHPGNGALSNNRHLWRVMGMIETSDTNCGLVAPSTQPLNGGSCSVPASSVTGFEGYKPSSSSASSSSGGGNFFQQLWNSIFGGGHA
ncbi:MAG TPA: MlaD family protein [Candidatus Solibacter sp.]|jgi:virulence factor Mce-like protein|nr:MlaD family protein [Candidatus Solibacter sp.]